MPAVGPPQCAFEYPEGKTHEYNDNENAGEHLTGALSMQQHFKYEPTPHIGQ